LRAPARRPCSLQTGEILGYLSPRTSFILGDNGALGANAGGTSRVMKRLQELLQRLVCSAAFESECALAHRREHDFARQDLGRKLSLAEPFEAAQREHQRIDLAGVQLADPRVPDKPLASQASKCRPR
jgi:hypothetical protein